MKKILLSILATISFSASAIDVKIAPLEKEFILMVLSKTGQAVVVKDGYVSLPQR